MKEAVDVKMEAFRGWLTVRTVPVADRYHLARRACSHVMEAKTWVWEEVGKAMERDFLA